MVDFSHLLRRPAGQAKRPPTLPVGDYPGVVKGFERGDNNKNKTPYVRFSLQLLGPANGAPDSWDVTDPEGKITTYTWADVDFSKRQFRRDFYITEDALWRLDEFIRSCGVPLDDRMYEEVIPELVGAQVLVEIQQYINQQTSEIGNQVGKLVGAS